MQEFDVFREQEGIRILSDTGKRHLYVTCTIWWRKLVWFESDSEFSV